MKSILRALFAICLVPSLVIQPGNAAEASGAGLLVFQAVVPGETHPIYTIQTDGRGLRLIVDAGSRPAWSPDAKKIYFVRNDLFSVNFDGTSPFNLTSGVRRLPTTGTDYPVATADGTKVAFYLPGAPLTWHTIKPDGTGYDFFPNGRFPARGGGLPIAVSPDGRKYSQVAGGRSAQIYVHFADGSPERALTRAGDRWSKVNWSPDGRRLVYASHEGDICIVNEDDTGFVRLTRGTSAISDRNPVWAPDGQTIYFIRTQWTSNPPNEDANGIYSMRPSGEELRRIYAGHVGWLDMALLPPTTDILGASDLAKRTVAFGATLPDPYLRVSFRGSDDSGIHHFECALDGASFSTCVSPMEIRVPAPSGRTPVKHTLKVRAVDNAGVTDPTPAQFTWLVTNR